jgi:tetratricopeptide (TPR) repeat protein
MFKLFKKKSLSPLLVFARDVENSKTNKYSTLFHEARSLCNLQRTYLKCFKTNMKITTLLFFFLLFTYCAFGQTQKLTTEDIFNRYLISEDESIAKTIINSRDGLYSVFCQGMLTEDPIQKIQLFTKFIQLNPNRGLSKAYLYRGTAYTLSEKYDSALLDYNECIRLDTTEPYAFYFRGESYAQLDKYDEAIEDYSHAIEMKSTFMLAYFMRGLSFLSKEDYTNALTDFNKTTALNKKYDKAYLMRGIVFNTMGDYKKAIANWKEAKKINKDNSADVDELIEQANKKMKEKK